MLLNNHGERRNQKRKPEKYFELNEDENPIYQNMWITANIVYEGTFTVLNAH